MLSKWVQFSPPDERGSKYVATLEALKSVVDRAGFAADVKKLTLEEKGMDHEWNNHPPLK